MKEERKLAYYFGKYSVSLQRVSFERLNNFYHDNNRKLVDFVYLCPLCLKNKIAILDDNWLRYEEEFTLDHFPPSSVGGKDTILVCKSCNEKAGKDFDFSLKEWINFQSFDKGIPNSQVPVELILQDTKGKYKGSLIMQQTNVLTFDNFTHYPLVNKWFEKVLGGQPSEQTIRFHPPNMELVFKALLKISYLYCFSIWGYDFVYSNTGLKIRKVLFENEVHPLSNCGIFFHMDNVFPPNGLCYVYKPDHLQTFMINYKLVSKDVEFCCGISVLIPGAQSICWDSIKIYQPLIDEQDKLTFALVRLPENTLTNSNPFPYTDTWRKRFQMPIPNKAY